VKRFFAVVVLTPAEQRLIIVVVVLFVAGAWYKHYRDASYTVPPAPTPLISPSPNER
jgi:hypothetical protein